MNTLMSQNVVGKKVLRYLWGKILGGNLDTPPHRITETIDVNGFFVICLTLPVRVLRKSAQMLSSRVNNMRTSLHFVFIWSNGRAHALHARGSWFEPSSGRITSQV